MGKLKLPFQHILLLMLSFHGLVDDYRDFLVIDPEKVVWWLLVEWALQYLEKLIYVERKKGLDIRGGETGI